jgi:predicted DCC family thiol-disulfide oxidoreductase YuxK
MGNLFVIFDSNCQLCGFCKDWLNAQRQIVPLTFIPAQSSEAWQIFPVLDHSRTLEEITVIADTGAVYEGAKAWLMVLWALADYRAWSYQLATPGAIPVARQFVHSVSQNRKALSRLFT